MREIVHLQAGQCGNQIGAKVSKPICVFGVLNRIILFRNTVFSAPVAGALCLLAYQKPHPRNIDVP